MSITNDEHFQSDSQSSEIEEKTRINSQILQFETIDEKILSRLDYLVESTGYLSFPNCEAEIPLTEENARYIDARLNRLGAEIRALAISRSVTKQELERIEEDILGGKKED